ncbi:MAG: AI-2E family transporter [Betaproteobacteria bacterium]
MASAVIPGRPAAKGRAPVVEKGTPEAAAAKPSLTTLEIAIMVIAVAAAIAIARVAEPFLVPVVVGILLSYTLRPLVSQLERIHLPRIVAATLVMAILVSLVTVTGYAIRDNVTAAVAELPVAARKFRQEASAKARQAPGPVAQIKAAAAELERADAESSGRPATSVATPRVGVAEQLQSFVTEQSSKALTVLVEIFVAMILAMFLLASGDTFRRKVTRIAGVSLARRRVTVEALDEIDAQIQAYMITLLFANVLIGLASWGGLWLLGVANAGMWGVLIGVLHIIPYAGSAVAAGVVGIAVYVQGGGIGEAAVAVGLIVAIATIIGMGLATWIQGRAVRMNPVAVFVGVLFFGWLWGGWGLLLGTPLLSVLKSIADRVQSMQPVSELLGP